MPKTRGWTRRELLLALGLYFQTDFGRLHRSNPDVVALAAAIGRTPSAVAMKACNFASLDPALQQSGLSSTSRADRQIWKEFQADSESLANEIGILADEVNLPLSPALSAPTPTSPVAGERAGVRGKPDTARDAHSASVIPAEAGLHRPPAAGLPQSSHHAPRDEAPPLDVLSTTNPRSSQIAPPAGLVTRSVPATLPAGPTDAQTLVRTRRVQSFFRRAVLISYNGRCALTGLPVQSLLNASHIIPWSVSTSRRADPTNGLCLSVLFDRAFDRGLLTFDEDLRVVLSRELKHHLPQPHLPCLLTAAEGARLHLPPRFPPDAGALEYHREHVFCRYGH